MRDHSFPTVLQRRLRIARVDQNMTQPELAKASGLSVGQISHYETGLISTARKQPYLPSVPNLRRLAIALGKSVDWLLGLSDHDDIR